MLNLATATPDQCAAMIGQPVTVHLANGATAVNGNVYTVDPDSRNLLIIVFGQGEDDYGLTLVPGQSVTGIEPHFGPPNGPALPAGCRKHDESTVRFMDSLFLRPDTEETDPNTEANVNRRRVLIAWLRHNHITVADRPDGSLLIFDSAIVLPPYKAEDCMCDNEVVLQRVRHFVANMPNN